MDRKVEIIVKENGKIIKKMSGVEYLILNKRPNLINSSLTDMDIMTNVEGENLLMLLHPVLDTLSEMVEGGENAIRAKQNYC